MSFDISNLGAYIGNVNANQYALQAVSEAPFFKLMMSSGNCSFGVKGKEAIQKISNTITLLDGSVCSRTGGSGVALSQAYITATQIAEQTDLCAQQLHNTFYSQSLLQGQSPNEEFVPAFVNAIIGDRSNKIAFANESLMFKGNTAFASGNLKRIDGVLTQLTGATYVTSATSATTVTVQGTDMVSKLQSIFTGSSASVRSQADYYIFVSQMVYDEYTLALGARNIYQATDAKVLFATRAKLYVSPGLNPDSNTDGRTVFAGRLSDMQAATDGKSDWESAGVKYSIETYLTYMDFKYALGVAVIWPNQFAIGKV